MSRDTSIPTYADWTRALPAEKRDLFRKHFEIGRQRIEQAFEEGTNIHGRGTCPCMKCNEIREGPARAHEVNFAKEYA